MDTGLLITPAAGAVIGYFTNYLAIKMLFRPYTEKYIFGMKVPFTPGLIPKEKERMAKALGDAIGTHLLNDDVVMSSLTKDDVIESINTIINNIILNAKTKDISLGTLCSNNLGINTDSSCETISNIISEYITSYISTDEFKNYFYDAAYNKVKNYLDMPLSEISYEKISSWISDTIAITLKDATENEKLKAKISSSLWNSICSKRDDERKLSDILSSSTQNEIKDFLSLKTPTAINMLLSAAEDEEVETLLKSKLSGAISAIAGPFMGMFINSDDIYVKIITQITEYINNPENMPEIEKAIDKISDKFFDCTAGSVITYLTSDIRENVILKAVSFAMDETLNDEGIKNINSIVDDFFENNKNRSVLEILNSSDSNFENKIKEFIYNLCDKFLTNSCTNYVSKLTSSFVQTLFNTSVSNILSRIDEPSINKVQELCINVYKKCVSIAAPKLLNAFNISSVVEERIESFSMAEIERIIVEIADRELKSITAVGGVLGFVIGFIPILASLI